MQSYRWSLIAGHLTGRTDNEIKNYWNSHLSRRIHSFRKIGSENEIVTMVLDKVPGGGKRRGGRTSRSAMKKNSTNVNSTEKEEQCKGSCLSNSMAQSDGGSNITLEPQQLSSRSTTSTFGDLDQDLLPSESLDPSQLLMSPVSQVVDSDWWDPDDLFGAPSEDSGAMGADSGALALNEVGPGAHQQMEEAARPTPSTSSAQVEEILLDWDMGLIENAKLWADEGETRSWLWGTEGINKDFEAHEIEGCSGQQVDSFASWLL